MSQPGNTDLNGGTSPAQFSTGGMLLKLILLPGLAVLLIVLLIVWLQQPRDETDLLPGLLEAARSPRSADEADVRLAALEAIAVLVSRASPARLRNHPDLVPVLLEAAEDERREVRERAAFTLGVVGGDRAEACLERMLADAKTEVRYNAATGLARHGNAKCIAVLREMLDPQQADSRRAMIRVNALRAIDRLADANPNADLGHLAEAVEQLTRADVATEVGVKAADVLRRLDRRRGTADRSRS
jgi:HEAT repeat protein